MILTKFSFITQRTKAIHEAYNVIEIAFKFSKLKKQWAYLI